MSHLAQTVDKIAYFQYSFAIIGCALTYKVIPFSWPSWLCNGSFLHPNTQPFFWVDHITIYIYSILPESEHAYEKNLSILDTQNIKQEKFQTVRSKSNYILHVADLSILNKGGAEKVGLML